MWQVQSILHRETTFPSPKTSYELVGHINSKIQQVIPAFQLHCFARCLVENFEGINQGNLHNEVEKELPVFFGGSANRIFGSLLHAPVNTTHEFLICSNRRGAHNFLEISSPCPANNWTITQWAAICAQYVNLNNSTV